MREFVAPRAEYYKRRGQLLEVKSGAHFRVGGHQDAWFHEKGKTCHCGVSDEYLKLWRLITRKEAIAIAKKLGVELHHETMSPSALEIENTQERLWLHAKEFIKTQNICCAETIYQTDRVIENGYAFIAGCCDIVGYEKDEDSEDDT